MKYNYHYTYRITNIKTRYHYSGSRSCNCLPIKDIGYTYFSSSTNKLFIQDQKNNPSDYIYKVVYINEQSREFATNFEIKYHKRLNVRDHKKFINKNNQTSSGFDRTGTIPWNKYKKGIYSKETLLKMSVAAMGRIFSEETKKKISETSKGPNKPHSEQTKKKMSKAAIIRHNNIKHPMLGKSHSEETKKKMSISANGRKHSKETKLNYSETRKGSKNNNAKSIHIFNKNNEVMFKCCGNFDKICNDNDLPGEQLKATYQKIYYLSLKNLVFIMGGMLK